MAKQIEIEDDWFADFKAQCLVCGNEFWSRHTKKCPRRNGTRICFYCCRKCSFAKRDFKYCCAIRCTWEQA